MKKSSKMILLAAFSYVLVEEPEFCKKLLEIVLEAAAEHKEKDEK